MHVRDDDVYHAHEFGLRNGLRNSESVMRAVHEVVSAHVDSFDWLISDGFRLIASAIDEVSVDGCTLSIKSIQTGNLPFLELQ